MIFPIFSSLHINVRNRKNVVKDLWESIEEGRVGNNLNKLFEFGTSELMYLYSIHTT